MAKVEQHIIDFVINHGKAESLGFNNTCFAMYINPTDERKEQYEINRDFILSHFGYNYWMKEEFICGEQNITLFKTQLHQTKPFGCKEISLVEYLEITEMLNKRKNDDLDTI